MKKRIFVFTGIAVAALLFAQQAPKKNTAAATPPAQPKLVVGIVIDQMRFDYIYRFWNKFGNGGFKRLIGEGFFSRNVNYNYVPTFTGPGHTSIFTGTTPCIHGIIANDWYDRAGKKGVYCVDDETVQGVGSDVDEGKRSPRNELTTTIGDQLRLATNMTSKVIGISVKDRAAILPAGHTANAAYWFESKSGNFISSTYYMQQLPQWVNDFNAKKLPAKYIAQDWTTLLPADQYNESMQDDNSYEGLFVGETHPVFPHKIPALAAANGQLGIIRSTPFGNSFLEDFAEATILGEHLGKNSATDFLSVSFSSTDYIGHMYGPRSMEIEDCYLRLDKNLADFFSFLDAQFGKNNVLVFLTADHGVVENPQFLTDNNIPSGYFNEEQAMDSLQQTLKRTYGDTLVAAYANDQIFLDHKAMEAKKLNKTEVENFVADFLLRFKGVMRCITSSSLAVTQFTSRPEQLVQNGFNFKRSGDVCVILQPGWFGEWPTKTGTTHGAAWNYDTHVPLLWWGWKIKNGSSDAPQNITDIAPTVCLLLNIQFPDGCTGQPISGIVK